MCMYWTCSHFPWYWLIISVSLLRWYKSCYSKVTGNSENKNLWSLAENPLMYPFLHWKYSMATFQCRTIPCPNVQVSECVSQCVLSMCVCVFVHASKAVWMFKTIFLHVNERLSNKDGKQRHNKKKDTHTEYTKELPQLHTQPSPGPCAAVILAAWPSAHQ